MFFYLTEITRIDLGEHSPTFQECRVAFCYICKICPMLLDKTIMNYRSCCYRIRFTFNNYFPEIMYTAGASMRNTRGARRYTTRERGGPESANDHRRRCEWDEHNLGIR